MNSQFEDVYYGYTYEENTYSKYQVTAAAAVTRRVLRGQLPDNCISPHLIAAPPSCHFNT